jgi:peptidyl-prolyl cis-trans isomerase SurA
MKYRYNTLFFLFLILIPTLSEAVIIDRIVAVVNDEIITLSEIDEVEYMLINGALKTDKGKMTGIPDRKTIKKKILDQFIEKKLQLQEADRLKIKATDENINNAIQEIKDKNNIADDRELEESLQLQGLTLEDLRRQIGERIKVAKLINLKVRAKVQITEDDVRAYYQKNLVKYRLLEEVKARHILIQVPRDASPETVKEKRQRLETIARELETGADFAETAKKFSEAPDAMKGGDLGYFKKGRMIPEIDQVVFTLRPGQRSGVVRTPFGFHIFEVLDRKEHTIDNDQELRKEIEDILNRKKTERRLQAFMSQLKKKAFINIPEEKP